MGPLQNIPITPYEERSSASVFLLCNYFDLQKQVAQQNNAGVHRDKFIRVWRLSGQLGSFIRLLFGRRSWNVAALTDDTDLDLGATHPILFEEAMVSRTS